MEEQPFIPNNDWAEFDGIAYPASRRGPRVTLNRDGLIRFGMKSMEALNHPKAVKLFYDGRRSRIGVKPSTTDDPRPSPSDIRQNTPRIHPRETFLQTLQHPLRRHRRIPRRKGG